MQCIGKLSSNMIDQFIIMKKYKLLKSFFYVNMVVLNVSNFIYADLGSKLTI